MAADVIIIGGGISGTAAAYHLAQRGMKVLLLERDHLAGMASGWTLAGVRQSGRNPAELPLAQAAIRRWEQLADELGTDVEYRQEGNLRLALTEEDMPLISRVVEEGNAVGIETHFLQSPGAVLDVAPALSPDLFGASYCPFDGHVNPTLAVGAFAAAAERLGAEIRTGVHVLDLTHDGTRVTGVDTSDGPIAAGTVIVAAGIYTPQLIAPLGLYLPITVTIVAAIQSIVMPPMLKQVLGLASGGVAGRQEVSGRFRFTGSTLPWGETGTHTGENVLPSTSQVQDTIARTIRILPEFASMRLARTWGGLLDATPDVIPVLQCPTGYEGLVVAAGFSGHGFCLGPITGEILSDLATDGTTRHPIDAFTIERFQLATSAREAAQLHG